jgi:glycosyltransferase involved in cell wall biosynthesis
MKQAFLIPVYRHGSTAVPLIESLSRYGLPSITIDDGNSGETRDLLAKAAAGNPLVTLVRLEKNSGKGAALRAGFLKADEIGIDQALQIDADGQHDTDAIPRFLNEAEKYPDFLICGCPEFDASAPRGRVIGRKISTWWARLETLSPDLADVMCGFRVYPVRKTAGIFRRCRVDSRMGYDADILIRLYWEGVRPLFLPVRVFYPAGGISNFRVWQDNARISLTFARLFCAMLPRIPRLIRMRKQ